MRGTLLTINHSFFFFVATIYVGAMWTIRFFFYPSWKYMKVADLAHHFVIPVTAARRFFTIVLTPMLLAGVVMIVTEWGKAQLWQAIVAFTSVSISIVAFEFFIKPVNARIAQVTDDKALTPLLQKWMALNNIRFASTTVTWLATLWYFVGKSHLTQALQH